MSLVSLQQSGDDRFRAGVAATAVGMAILSLDGGWQEVNPALARLLDGAVGLPADGEGGAGTLFDVIQPTQAAGLRSELGALVRGDVGSIDRSITCRRGSGDFEARINLAVLSEAADQPSGLVLQLQQDRAAGDSPAMEAMRRQLQVQVDAVAHDLRAPLRSIENFSGLLARKLGDEVDAAALDHLGRIRGAASRMARLLDGLTELSRAGTAEIRSTVVDLSLLAEWVAAEQQDAHPDREFQITVQSGLATQGDERLLKAMLAQMVDNARRFSHEGAPVVIEVAGEVVAGMLHLSVRDHGRGFDMRYKHKLFEPFQRLHGGDEGAGDGLGLAIAQRIAERHGGHIDAESDMDTGTVFHIHLPAAHAAGASSGE